LVDEKAVALGGEIVKVPVISVGGVIVVSVVALGKDVISVCGEVVVSVVLGGMVVISVVLGIMVVSLVALGGEVVISAIGATLNIYIELESNA
jgi:hypothetical protein